MKTARFFTVKGGYPDMGALVESRVGARYGGTLMGGFSGDPGRSPVWRVEWLYTPCFREFIPICENSP